MTEDIIPIRRALASVTDKSGIAPFFGELTLLIPELTIISTGGTARLLAESGLTVTPIEEVTQFPECFDGRVKTLHPLIHGGILFKRDVHDRQARDLGIQPIDLVVCNLYDFASHLTLEHMDIGGPSMIRSAIKNFAHVAVVVDPSDYHRVTEEIRLSGGLRLETRRELAVKALNLTADYEAMLATELTRRMMGEETARPFLRNGRHLRYGENPSQEATVYATHPGVASARVVGGKELSYNNYEDTSAAYRAGQELFTLGHAHGVAIVKHGSICGFATASSAAEAFQLAWEGDPKSAFGGVIASTSPLSTDLCDHLAKKFIEVIIAPGYDEAFIRWARDNKPKLRLVQLDNGCQPEEQYRSISGGVLRQTPLLPGARDCGAASTQLQPSADEAELYRFAIAAVKHVKSNGVLLAHQVAPGSLQVVGIGAGQPNRVDSLERLAIPKATENLRRWNGDNADYDVQTGLSRCVLASDGFFPFADSIEAAAAHGITRCIQPGGSVRDQEVIESADRHQVCMVCTGERYFYH